MSSKDKKREFLDKVMKRLKMAVEAEDHNRTQAIEDLDFLNGDQWDKDELDRRTLRKRPALTINMLPEKVDKVVGDMRQNRAKVKIRVADGKANSEIALIREGMIRRIEYKSRAAAVYDYAGARVAECGEGTWRVVTQYCDDNPFVQEILIKIIKNSFAVYFDPKAEGHCKEDAKWAFILSHMDKDEFEETYPNASYPSDSMKLGPGLSQELWYTPDKVVVAEYFEVSPVDKVMCLMSNGDVLEKDEANKVIKRWESQWQEAAISTPALPGGPPAPGEVTPPSSPPPQPGVPLGELESGVPEELPLPVPAQGLTAGNVVTMPTVVPQMPMIKQGAPPKPVVLQEKKTKVNQVFRYVLNAVEILENKKRIPGKYIPIIRITGKERNVEGKDYYRGIVRDCKDPQRLVNYWNTSAAEYIALAPKTPWIGTAKQFEGFEEDYANANVDNLPFFKYNPDQNAQGPPMRTRPADPPIAMFTQIQIAERNLDRVADVGPNLRNIAPDASAEAIMQRQKPAELSSFPFIDNLVQGQEHTYRIINEMIPEVYDTERDVGVMGEDERESFVPINMSAEDAVKLISDNPDRYKGLDAAKIRKAILNAGANARFNDIGVGRYEVVVTVGPSFATQRQEAADKFTMLAQTYPRLWEVAGDLIVKSLDVTGADELAARLRKILPPGMIVKKEGEPQDPPPPPSPQARLIMAKTQTETLKQKKEAAKVNVELIKAKTELIKQYMAMGEGEAEMRKVVLGVLNELHASEHPADEFQGMFGQEGEGGGTAQ